jgi:hypothetical protein
MITMRWILLLCFSLISLPLLAKTGISFNTEQNKLCWRMIEQKASGHCRLHFSGVSALPGDKFAERDLISRAFSDYLTVRKDFPTSFQQLEFALQFFYYSLERFPVRDSLNFIRSNDGAIQLSMSIRTSATGGYSFVLADNDAQIRQIMATLQNDNAAKASNYYRTIAKLFAD